MRRTRTAEAPTVVWLTAGTTRFASLCERCLDHDEPGESSFGARLERATVRGFLAPDAEVGFVRCDHGHGLVVRRGRAVRRPLRRPLIQSVG